MKLQRFGFQLTRQIFFLALVLCGLGAGALAAPSDRDPTFGDGGKVISPVGKFSADFGYATALQPDGKIIVAGRSLDGIHTNFMVARINADGSPDVSFGDKGFAIKKLFFGGYALAVVIQPDGKIIVGGHVTDQINYIYRIFTLVRFNSDGSADNTFGTNGVAQANLGTANSWITSLAVQSDGKIVAAGFTYINYSFQPNNFAVARFNSDGTTDNSFGSAGKVIIAFSFNDTKANSLVIQTDGKIIVGGYGNSSFQLVRLNADGTFDIGFDRDGKVSTQIGSGSAVYALALQNDGKIVAAGSSTNNTNSDVALARYNADGSLDSSFGTNGVVTTDVDGRQEGASAVIIQSNGKIVIGGTTSRDTSVASRDFLAVRYNADGALDADFGNAGKAVTNVSPTDDQASAAVVQPDGKIVLAGYSFSSNYDIALVRYNPDGSLDASFDGDGINLIETANAIDIIFDTAIQPDGKIVAVGYSFDGVYRNITVVRYNSNGTPDASFGDNGVVITSLGQTSSHAVSVLIQPDGRIVVGGNINAFATNSDFAVLRYNPDGLLDSSFSSSGVVTFPVGSNTDNLRAITLQGDGKIVAVGQARTTSNYNFAVARLNSNGSLDSSFGTNGKVLTPIAPGTNIANSAAIQNDGKIVVGGVGYNFANTGADFVLARYNSDGTLDNTFDGDGKVNTAFDGSSEDAANAISVQSDGKIVAAGYSNVGFALARYNSDGSLDASFDGDGKVMTAVGSNFLNNQIYDLAIQPNGKIIGVGSVILNDNYNSAIVRYNSNGSPDYSFGSGGIVTTTDSNEDDEFLGVALQPDGKIIAAGYSSSGIYAADFTIVRYQGGEAPVKSRKRVRFTF